MGQGFCEDGNENLCLLRQEIEELSGNKLLKKNLYHRDYYAARDNSVTGVTDGRVWR
jgi:hypothetical protein